MSMPDKPPSATPARLEQDIDHTRREIALTVAALEQKLAARPLMEKGLEMFTDVLANSDAVNRALQIIRSNPAPVALIGIGAAWLIASNTGVVERLAENEQIAAAGRRVADLANNVGTRAGGIAADVADRIGIGEGQPANDSDRPLGHTGNPMVDSDGDDRSEGWLHQASGSAQTAIRSARDSGSAALDRAGAYASEGAGRLADRVSDAFRRHPLAIGAVGVMAGTLIAALLPATRVEDELLGETRDQLWQKAQEAGEEAVTRVRDAAARTVVRAADAASDAAAQSVRDDLKSAVDKQPDA